MNNSINPSSKSKTAKPINARRKGHSFERALVAEFRSKGWIKACRNIETNPDAILGIDLLHTYPFAVQAKRLATYAPITRIFEIPTTSPATIPILITKPDEDYSNGLPATTMVVLPLHHFLAMISPETPGPFSKDDF